ncbi:MAG: DMT family transporter [bacterium]|nr:DMT family transporter [bacterium]
MTWFLYAFLSALLASGSALTAKKALLKEHAMTFAASLALLNAIISGPFLFFIDYARLRPTHIAAALVTSVIGAAAFLLITKAIRHMDVGEASPLLGLEPAVVAILALVLLGEMLSFLQITGILLVVLGSYALERHDGNSLWEPLRELVRKGPHRNICYAVVLYAITGIIERFAFTRLDLEPKAYLAFVQIFMAINFVVAISIFYGGIGDMRKSLSISGWWILLASLFTVLHRLLQLEAVRIAYVGLVITVKRTSAFFTIIAAGKFFHEDHLRAKLISSALIVSGGMLLALTA